jgi:hypothetical protein
MQNVDERGRGFLAGFLEGEASLSIRELNGGQSFSCDLALNQRDDAQDTMEFWDSSNPASTGGAPRSFGSGARPCAPGRTAAASSAARPCAA